MEFKKIKPYHVTDSRIPSVLGTLIDGDAHLQYQNRFCVSDGVTRDLRNDDEFRTPKSLDEVWNTIRYYPNVFELRRLSKLVCSHFIRSSSTDVSEILKEINKELKFWNALNF